MKQLTSDYVVNECVRYILENPIDAFTHVTLTNGMDVTIYKSDRRSYELPIAKEYIYGIRVSVDRKAEHFGFGAYLQVFFDRGDSSRQIFLDRYPQATFRVYKLNKLNEL